MKVVLTALMLLWLAACSGYVEASGSDGNLYWSLTIDNTETTGDGLVLIIVNGDGTSRSVTVPPGGSVAVPVNGSYVVVNGSSGSWRVAQGDALILPWPAAGG